jgi:hypothetical protein
VLMVSRIIWIRGYWLETSCLGVFIWMVLCINGYWLGIMRDEDYG